MDLLGARPGNRFLTTEAWIGDQKVHDDVLKGVVLRVLGLGTVLGLAASAIVVTLLVLFGVLITR